MDEGVVKYIKELLWNGETQMATGALASVSTTTVFKVMHGYTGGNVPWPDGSIGAMDKKRIAAAKEIRREKQNRAVIPTHIPNEDILQTREILAKAAVEAERRAEEELEKTLQEQQEQMAPEVDEQTALQQARDAAEARETRIKRLHEQTLADRERVWKEALRTMPLNKHVKAGLKNKKKRDLLCDVLIDIPHDLWRDEARLEHYISLATTSP